MQLHENVITVHTNSESQSFTIKTSAKAFKILSDNLYSNKIRAVVRELSTNAQDAHIAAGNPDPISVHLPNYDEPWFSVCDNGIGMDNDTIMTLYTSYFDSNKSDSNDFTGALGLGSKSPFAYTDSFIIESRYNGKKNLFTAFRGKTGTPEITHMSESDTNEPNGIMVRVQVNHYTMSNFIEEAAHVYAFFNPQPIITNVDNFRPISLGETIKTDVWSLFKGSAYNSSVYAVMGNVDYPVNLDSLDLDSQNSDVNFAATQHVRLNFDIGELDIAPSREALSYDALTVKNIITALDNMGRALKLMIQQEVNSQPSLWDAVVHFKKYVNENSIRPGRFEFKYNGTNVNGLNSFEFSKDELTKLECPISLYEREYMDVKKKNLMRDQWAYRINVAIDENTVIVVCDETPRTAASKIKHYILANRDKRVYHVEKECKQVLDHLGGVKYILSSSLEKPPRKKPVSNPSKLRYVWSSDYTIEYTTKLEDLDHFYYVQKKRNKYQTFENEIIGAQTVKTMAQALIALKILDKNVVVYSVDSTLVNKASFKNANKTELSELYSKTLDSLVEKKAADIKSYIRAEKEISALSHRNYQQRRIYDKIVSNIDMSTLNKSNPIVAINNRIKSLSNRMNRLMSNNRFSIAYNEAMKRHMFQDLEVKVSMPNIFDRYPMIKLIEWTNIDSTTISDIVDYMNTKDRG